jgi:hypothetical protein
MRVPWRLPISLAMLLALAGALTASGAAAASYVGRQADAAHGVVVLSVSGARIAAKHVALDCAKPGSALPGEGSGALRDGRFNVRIGYEYSPGRFAKPARLWATLTGRVHGATITGTLSTPRSVPCSGGRYKATASGYVASGGGGSPTVASPGEENENEKSTVPGAPFAEGNYEAAFNAAWEEKIEQLCHSRPAPTEEGVGPSATAATCSTPVAPEAIPAGASPVLQAE